MITSQQHDYHNITEAPGMKATREQLERLYHRYRFALEFACGKDVLEVACGSGIGLGFLAGSAKTVVGGDIDVKNLSVARQIYKDTPIAIQGMNAHNLPFKQESFDSILLFEAVYYLDRPDYFLKEASRVLRRDGKLIICTVNKDWKDFHPSPYAHVYYSVLELSSLLKGTFRHVQIFGAFPTMNGGIRDRFLSGLKRMAVHFDLIPGSLKARSYLKRLFIGPLQPLPERIIDGMARYEPPIPIGPDDPNRVYKIIYAVARKS